MFIGGEPRRESHNLWRSLRGSFQRSGARLMTTRCSAEGSCKASPKDSRLYITRRNWDWFSLGSKAELIRILSRYVRPLERLFWPVIGQCVSIMQSDWSNLTTHVSQGVINVGGRQIRKTDYQNPVVLSMNFFMY